MKPSFTLLFFTIFLFKYHIFAFNEIDPNDTSRNVVITHIFRNKEDFTEFNKIFHTGVTYRITFVGKYHIWENFNPQFGIDALYFQDIPIFKTNNPKNDSINQSMVNQVLSKKIPLYYDTKVRIPNPLNFGGYFITFNPYYDQGLRVNNKTINSYNLTFADSSKSIYQITIEGDNKNYNFKFLNFVTLESNERISTDYLSGDFYIYIRSFPRKDTCQTFIRSRGNYVEVQIDFAEIVVDTTYLKGITNLLKRQSQNIRQRKFTLRSQRNFYCIDSIECQVPIKNKNILLLVDRSNTMDQIVGQGLKKKIEIEKQLIQNFVNTTILPTDSVALITFNTSYELINWTNNKSLILDKINKLEPSGNTLLYKFLLTALEFLDRSPKLNKALVVFSDGINQPPYFDSTFLFEHLMKHIWKYKHIPIYFVVIPSNPSKDRDIGLQRLWIIKNTHSNSIFYSPDNISDLETSIQKITEDLSEELCCSIFLEIPNPCIGKKPNEIVYLELLYSPIEKDTIVIYKIPVYCKNVISNVFYSCLRLKSIEEKYYKDNDVVRMKYLFVNEGNLPLTISSFETEIPNLTFSRPLPLEIPPFDSIIIEFYFNRKPILEKDYIKVIKNSNCGDSLISLKFLNNYSNFDEISEKRFDFVKLSNNILEIYPNPIDGDDYLTLNLSILNTSPIQIKLFEHNGRMLYSCIYQPEHPGIHTQKLFVGNLSAGIYFIQIIANGKIETKPFVIYR
ncbi:MAG: VWA domain-containing protein [Ignavibacteria bacterium]|nr:VWA domain-containing protein [Ignavibacteria bacterium]